MNKELHNLKYWKSICLILFIHFQLATSALAQTSTIEGTKLTVTIPGNGWKSEKIDYRTLKGAQSVDPDKISTTAYIKLGNRSPNPLFDNSQPPTILITVEKNTIYKSSSTLAAAKNRTQPFTITNRYPDKTGKNGLLKLTNAQAEEFVLSNVLMDISVQGYNAYIISGSNAIVINCMVNKKEFLAVLQSISPSDPKANEQTPVAANIKINACDYMPLGKKMTYVFAENTTMPDNDVLDLAALVGNNNKPLTETYTFVKNKTVNGKILKGYKVESKDEAKNGQVIYYNCSNNNAITHAEIYRWVDEEIGSRYQGFAYIGPIYESTLTPTGRFTTLTDINGSVALGEIWTETGYINGVQMQIATSIDGVGLTLTVKGKQYNDVIKIVKTINQGIGLGSANIHQELYYAKGIGKIKVVNTMGTLTGPIINTLELTSFKIEK